MFVLPTSPAPISELPTAMAADYSGRLLTSAVSSPTGKHLQTLHTGFTFTIHTFLFFADRSDLSFFMRTHFRRKQACFRPAMCCTP